MDRRVTDLNIGSRRHLRERRQDPSLDRPFGLRARRRHQEAPRYRGQSLHNLAGFERDRIRETVAFRVFSEAERTEESDPSHNHLNLFD